MSGLEPFTIHWFRRDLRVAANPALKWSFDQTAGRVLGLFCFDAKFLSRADFSHARFQFFLESLKSLKQELKSAGGDLLVVDGQPEEIFARLLAFWGEKSRPLPRAVSFNRDYEPFARQRDERVTKLLTASGIVVHTEADHLLVEPQDLLKDDGGFYQVYSPFARRWFERLGDPARQGRLAGQISGLKYVEKMRAGEKTKIFKANWDDVLGPGHGFKDELDTFLARNSRQVSIPIPRAGTLAAWERVAEFRSKIEAYGERRDLPAVAGTSQLSVFFKNGSLTSAQVIAALDLGRMTWRSKGGAAKFLKEIVWREFYYHILYHCPRVEGEAFQTKYRDLPWHNDRELFRRWCEGTTGYPIVDAGMRQLLTTGWMHNRVRMIVASFLTKDLLIDWRWGENHFMKHLLDGDLAPNNGGWQWAASTGCDPQPYFRIFNPILQSRKFDPDGTYIKSFVPELRSVAAERLHDPADLPTGTGYPAPIVDHAAQKVKALALFKSV